MKRTLWIIPIIGVWLLYIGPFQSNLLPTYKEIRDGEGFVLEEKHNTVLFSYTFRVQSTDFEDSNGERYYAYGKPILKKGHTEIILEGITIMDGEASLKFELEDELNIFKGEILTLPNDFKDLKIEVFDKERSIPVEGEIGNRSFMISFPEAEIMGKDIMVTINGLHLSKYHRNW
ncbi:hypothetical protein [Pseudalkalibacillus sp. SCS-8]|uniref:hypothetical protein n=1 Tax=Pseudalkalibacillus nanhaiensis TaxID=3115291 RepID=UPI0032DB568D